MRLLSLILVLILASFPAIAGGISSNFFPASNSTLIVTASGTSQFLQFTTAAQLAAPDVLLTNSGSVIAYCDLGTGGVAFVTTVPTNSVVGGILLAPGTSRLLNKRANDTVACITATSTAVVSATPGIGR